MPAISETALKEACAKGTERRISLSAIFILGYIKKDSSLGRREGLPGETNRDGMDDLLDFLEQSLPGELSLGVSGGVVKRKNFFGSSRTEGLPEIPFAELLIGVGRHSKFKLRLGKDAPVVGAETFGKAVEILTARADKGSARQLQTEVGDAQRFGGLNAGFA